MVTLTGTSIASIQQALSALEDKINQLAGQTIDDVVMTVDPGSGGVPHGSPVRMTGNLLVDVSLGPTDWVGVNIGPAATEGDPVTIRGGKKVDALFAAGQVVNPGSVFYVSTLVAGTFTTIDPAGFGTEPAGVVYDATGYVSGTGGIVKAWINSNFPATPVP